LDVFFGWKQANQLFHFAFNGWVSRYLILWMEHISCSLHLWISITQAPIVCLHSGTYFMDEQANQLSLYLYCMDEKNQLFFAFMDTHPHLFYWLKKISFFFWNLWMKNQLSFKFMDENLHLLGHACR
jgi:hypothetical protein